MLQSIAHKQMQTGGAVTLAMTTGVSDWLWSIEALIDG